MMKGGQAASRNRNVGLRLLRPYGGNEYVLMARGWDDVKIQKKRRQAPPENATPMICRLLLDGFNRNAKPSKVS